MDHDTGGCPLMVGEASLCPMSVFDHITTWQSIFTFNLLEIFTFIALAVACVRFWLPVLKPERPPGYRRRSYPALPLLQELFSKGILHPKAP